MKEPNHSIKILTKFDVNRLTKLKRGTKYRKPQIGQTCRESYGTSDKHCRYSKKIS